MAPKGRGSLQFVHDEVDFYPHQIEGVRTMARMGSFLLADEMGLGKSLQSLTVAAIDFERSWAHRFVIVAPAGLKWNWEAEILEFTNYKCMVLDGTPAERQAQLTDFEHMGYHVLIVNYEQVQPHLADLMRMKFDIAIWDEAHYLKNPKAKRTKASLSLGEQIGRRFLLTGSPMLNQVDELWTLLHLIDPEEFPSYWRFVNRYCVFGGWKNKQIVGVKNKAELMTKLEGYMVRRLKKNVLNLPDKQHISVYVELKPEQRALYNEANDEMKITRPEGMTDMEIDNALTKYLRLSQICGTTFAFTGEDVSAKLDVAIEKILEVLALGEPIVVFTQFRAVIECLAVRLANLKDPIEAFQIHGDVPKETRVGVVKTWEAYKDSKGRRGVIIVGLKAGGVGLNMTAANKCIFIDKLYVPKLNEQAEDRLHRIGADLTQPVQIIDIIAKKTVEQRIETILRKKTKLFDSIVEDSDWKRALVQALLEDDD